MQPVINSAPAIQTPIDQQSTLKSEAVAVAPALSNASTQDLRAAQNSSVQPTQIKTVSEAIEAFADAVIREHNLDQFSAMPVDDGSIAYAFFRLCLDRVFSTLPVPAPTSAIILSLTSSIKKRLENWSLMI